MDNTFGLFNRELTMKLKHLLSICCLSAISFMGQAKNTTQVTVRAELASPIVLENSIDSNYLKVALTGFALDTQQRSPINLALVIDRSTSMSGDRIENARAAAILAINMLDKQDTLTVVAYDSRAEVLIPATKVTNKAALINIINQKVHPQGMTALFAGLSKGLNQLDKYLDKEQINRVILLSDGQANVGPTSINELSELAKIAASKGIAITTMGIGNGYNEDLMVAIAGYSDGNHAFVNNASDLENVFVREFKDVMSVIAQEVTVTIDIAQGAKPVRLLGREGEIIGNSVKVKMNQLYSNQEKYVLLEVMPEKGIDNEEKNIASISVSYDNLATKQTDQFTDTIKVQYSKYQEIVQSAVVENVLVDSEVQKAAIENERALKLYDQGNIPEAKLIMSENSDRLNRLAGRLHSNQAVEKVSEQAIKTQTFADDITDKTKDNGEFRKEFIQQQYEVKQNINK